jgi:hypothetical protein
MIAFIFCFETILFTTLSPSFSSSFFYICIYALGQKLGLTVEIFNESIGKMPPHAMDSDDADARFSSHVHGGAAHGVAAQEHIRPSLSSEVQIIIAGNPRGTDWFACRLLFLLS